jgi:hypothetical protein
MGIELGDHVEPHHLIVVGDGQEPMSTNGVPRCGVTHGTHLTGGRSIRKNRLFFKNDSV